MPDVVPFLTYEDGIAALEWLAEVFGFTETARFTSSDGRLSHGEMSIGDGVIMLASQRVAPFRLVHGQDDDGAILLVD